MHQVDPKLWARQTRRLSEKFSNVEQERFELCRDLRVLRTKQGKLRESLKRLVFWLYVSLVLNALFVLSVLRDVLQ